MKLEVIVAPSGSVARAAPVNDRLLQPEVTACIVAGLRSISFPASPALTKLEVTLDFAPDPAARRR